MRKAVVLLSGGLDSATTLYLAKTKGYKVYCLIFDYGQRHRREINSAVKIARSAKCDYRIIKIDLPWKGSSLLDRREKLPTSNFQLPASIPSTYVPARNTIFLSFALSYVEALGADSIFIGANAIDFSGYPDCRPQYYQVFEDLIREGTKAGVEGKKIKIYTPLINKAKEEIIRLGIKLGVPYNLTWSCYKGGKSPCGVCDSCMLRKRGFRRLKINDPIYG